jgi:hypothetical protein
MSERRRLLVAIIRGATELLDYDLSPDQVETLQGIVRQLDDLVLSAHEETSP